MAASSIEWTDSTWNPVVGCTWASPGCDHCYAVPMTRRLEAMGQEKYSGLVGKGHFNSQVRTHADALDVPLGWKEGRRIFVNSMSDLFHPKTPFEFIDQVFAVMALSPQHTFQVLTKRAGRMEEYLRHRRTMLGSKTDEAVEQKVEEIAGERGWCPPDFDWPLPNVWLGVSVEDQERADERIPHLLRCPAAVRFLSCEPLLSVVDLRGKLLEFLRDGSSFFSSVPHSKPNRLIDWVIVGGESGPDARACNLAWIRSLLDQCRGAGVACFVKQLGSHPVEGGDFHQITGPMEGVRLKSRKGGDPTEWPVDLRVRQFPEVQRDATAAAV